MEFERFWEWLMNKSIESDYDNLDEWLRTNFLSYLAEKRPNGWSTYIDDLYEPGYITKDVYKEELI